MGLFECRPMHLKRPIGADRQISECRLVLDRRLCRLLFLAVLIALLLQVQSKDISSMNRTFQELVNNNRTKNNSSFLTNEIATDSENDNDNFQLGYSGYLRSSTSMLTLRHNITNSILATSHNGTPDRSAEASGGHRRFKRGVSHLYNMIVCATGCNPLAYKGYGCYCGFLGSGYPMDGIDRCCKMHDWCYDATECPMFVEYFVPYYWKCYRGYKPICAIEHGEWGSSGSCAQRLCECDRSFAECLRRYRCPRHKAVCTSSPWRLIQNIFMII